MTRDQAEAMIFRTQPAHQRAYDIHGNPYITINGAQQLDLANIYYRDFGERVLIARLSDDEIRALLPAHLRDTYTGARAA